MAIRFRLSVAQARLLQHVGIGFVIGAVTYLAETIQAARVAGPQVWAVLDAWRFALSLGTGALLAGISGGLGVWLRHLVGDAGHATVRTLLLAAGLVGAVGLFGHCATTRDPSARAETSSSQERCTVSGSVAELHDHTAFVTMVNPAGGTQAIRLRLPTDVPNIVELRVPGERTLFRGDIVTARCEVTALGDTIATAITVQHRSGGGP